MDIMDGPGALFSLCHSATLSLGHSVTLALPLCHYAPRREIKLNTATNTAPPMIDQSTGNG
jgi:hypothetical protein